MNSKWFSFVFFTAFFCFLTSKSLAQYQDCLSAQVLCTKDSLTIPTVTGPGNFENIVASSCFQDQEHQSHWFTFYATKSGTFEFSIRSINYLADYDFAMWEGGCPGAPGSKVVACNWLGAVTIPPYYATGVSNDPLNSFGEGVNLEFINTISITAGKVYYLLVDNISNNGVGFTIRFGGTSSIGNPVLTYTAGIYCNQTSEDLKDVKVVGLDSVPGNSVYFSKYLDAINNSNPLINTIVNNSGNYYVTKTTPHGCKATQTINVTLENPDVVIKDVFTCGNPSFDLTTLKKSELSGLNILDFNFNYFNSQQDLLNNTNQIPNLVTKSGTVWAKATTLNGCVDIIPFNIQLEKPTISLTGSTEICPGKSLFLPIVYNGQWPIDITVSINGTAAIQDFLIKGEPIVVQPQKNSIYTIAQAIDTFGCSAIFSGSYEVIVHEKPVIKTVLTDCTSFQGEPILKITIEDGDPASYKITGITGILNGNVFTSDKLIDGNTYTFQVEDKYQCGFSDWTGIVKCNCDPAFLVEISEVVGLKCSYSSNGALTSKVSGGAAPFNFEWDNGLKSQDLSPISSGNYQLKVTDANGCTTSASYNLIAPSQLVAEPIISNVICTGADDGFVEVTNLSGGTPPYVCILQGTQIGNSPFLFENLQAGDYNIKIVDGNMCSVDLPVKIKDGEIFTLNLGPDLEKNEGELIQIKLTGDVADIDKIDWQSNYDFECLGCSEFEYLPAKDGYFIFSASNKNGCVATDTINIAVRIKSITDKIFLPNSFSPDGDGINDFFKPYFGDITIAKSSLSIYNRWGGQIYFEEFVDDPKGWNGRFGGKYLNSDVFVYILNVELTSGSKISIKGDINLFK